MNLFKFVLVCFLFAYGNVVWALPPQAEADMLMVSIKNDMDAGRCSESLSKFEKISRLNRVVKKARPQSKRGLA